MPGRIEAHEPRVAGLVLAAGAGRRYGQPKALVREQSGLTWVEAAVAALTESGCDEVYVAVGAAARDVAALVEATATVVPSPGWEAGMHASFNAGISALRAAGADVAVVMLVDLPDVGAAVITHVLEAIDLSPATLARAAYDGRAGHPVVIGSDHFDGVLAASRDDAGAREYLQVHEPELVECAHLASGRDRDRPV